MLPYDELMALLDLSSMRELEDFVIQDCIYPALLKCKLDQKERCLRVQDAFPRDVRPQEMPAVTAALQTWCAPKALTLFFGIAFFSRQLLNLNQILMRAFVRAARPCASRCTGVA